MNFFGFDGKIRRSPSNQDVWECLIGGNAFSKILKLCGTPFGNKVSTEFYVQEWILSGSIGIKSRYLQRLFDCEGWVTFQKNNRIIIGISMYKFPSLIQSHIRFLNQLRHLLSEMQIKSTNPSIAGYTKRKDGITTVGYEFQIYGTRKKYDFSEKFHK